MPAPAFQKMHAIASPIQFCSVTKINIGTRVRIANKRRHPQTMGKGKRYTKSMGEYLHGMMLHCLGKTSKRLRIQHHNFRVIHSGMQGRVKQGGGVCIQKGRVRSQNFSKSHQMCPGPLLQQGHEVKPDTVTRVHTLCIRTVFTPGNPARNGPILNPVTPASYQRPDDRYVIAPGHGGETGRTDITCEAEHSQQNGFHLVILLVPGSDRCTSPLPGRTG